MLCILMCDDLMHCIYVQLIVEDFIYVLPYFIGIQKEECLYSFTRYIIYHCLFIFNCNYLRRITLFQK